MTPLFRLLPAVALIAFAPPGSSPAAEGPAQRPTAEAGIGRMVPEVAFTDLSGGAHKLSEIVAGQPLTVLALTSSSCPLCGKFAPTLSAMEKEWSGKGVRFVFVGSIDSDTPAELSELAGKQELRGVFTADLDHSLAKALHAESTTEVFVLDRARTLQYRGAVDDQYGLGYQKDQPARTYLADALTSLSAGKTARPAATTAPGCVLDLAVPAETADLSSAGPGLTWHRDISRLIQRNCQECHRDGGIAPFSLATRADVISHAGMIKKVVTKGLMPPWYAAPQTGEHRILWANDRSLPDTSRDGLLTWLAGDRAEGDPADAPVPRTWPQDWVMGTPDSVVDIPDPVNVKATGRMNYIIQQVETSFPEDRWITAMEVRPTAVAQVHHVLVFVAAPGKRVQDGDDFLAAYVPGSSMVEYPEGYAKKLPAGAKILFQLHYTPNGTEAVDKTRLGLRFTATPPKYEVHVAAAKQTRFAIPPGADNHEVKGVLPVPFDSQILSFMPHMHMRGKDFRYELVAPDGSRRELLSVPAYDFNWQILYRAAEPVEITRGSRIEATAHFDNSAGNPSNPDPTKTVRWGLQTEEEMMIGYLEYVRKPASVAELADAALPFSMTPKALGALGRRLDTNKDGKISLEEAGALFRGLHQRLDSDRDGFVTAAEARGALRH